jgi:hypothetical protein
LERIQHKARDLIYCIFQSVGKPFVINKIEKYFAGFCHRFSGMSGSAPRTGSTRVSRSKKERERNYI